MTQIINHRTNRVLYQGRFASLRACAEHAVKNGVRLDFADLRRANLVGASLDGASLRGACMAGANLMGANVSEAVLDGADLSGAGLQNTCLCYSSLRGCVFIDALFGATDIAGAAIDRCMFSTLSALHLPFRDTGSMQGCAYIDPDGVHCPFSRPPLVIGGLAWPVVVMDRHVKIGGWLVGLDGLLSCGLPDLLAGGEKNWLMPLIESCRSGALPAGTAQA